MVSDNALKAEIKPQVTTNGIANGDTQEANKKGQEIEKTQHKASGTDGGEKKKGPPGGFDSTPIPKTEPGYTLKFTFHRATNLPPADIQSMSSDPYLVAHLKTSLPLRHKQDPRICWRIPTKHRTCEPDWNSYWIVANVPPSGFRLKCRLYDEDPADHDDRLGNIHVDVGNLTENWSGIKEQAYDIKKRMGSKRAYMLKGCAAMFSRGVKYSGQVIVSIEMLGRSDVKSGGRMFTIGPCQWSQHYSPLIGRLAGTKDPVEDAAGHTEKKSESYK
jgi:hypothetical protein